LGNGNNGKGGIMGIWGLISGNYKILLVRRVTQADWTGPQYLSNTNPTGGIPAVEDCNEGGLFTSKKIQMSENFEYYHEENNYSGFWGPWLP
jgi:hypothetical protein